MPSNYSSIQDLTAMAYNGTPDYDHANPARVGLLLTNLGTPEAATPKALRKYLAEFLWDPRVVEIPRPIWWLILNLIILNVRPKRSAETYAKIWTPAGSPLMQHTLDQTAAVKQYLADIDLTEIEVACAMRYGQPSIESTLYALQKKNVTRLLVMPLYPQYSAATTASTFDAVAQTLSKMRWMPELRFINQYCDQPLFIKACAKQISDYWKENKRSEKLLFSFHGVPKRYLLQGDPYHCQCHKTARLIVEELGLSSEEYLTTFQSRFGREEWLKPYTDETLEQLGKDKLGSIDIFCPGFSSDCVETLEEMDMLNREVFTDAGGGDFQYIPALNSTPHHVQAIAEIARQHMQGWPQVTAEYDWQAHHKERDETRRLALEMGSKN